jgi:ribonuclease D
LLAAIQEATALPEDALPRMPHVPRPVVSDAARKRIDALRKWRAEEAARLGLDVSVVLPQRLLEQVAEKPPSRAEDLLGIEGFRKWRVGAFGAGIVAAASDPAPRR